MTAAHWLRLPTRLLQPANLPVSPLQLVLQVLHVSLPLCQLNCEACALPLALMTKTWTIQGG